VKIHADAPVSVLEGADRIQEIVRKDFAGHRKAAALSAFARGDNEKALMELERTNDLMPDQNEVMAYLGFAYERNGRLDRANEMRQELQQQGINVAWVRSMARGLIKNPSDLNNLELSDSFAVWLSPEEPSFRVERGLVSLRAGRFDDTITDLRAALEFFNTKAPTGEAPVLWARLVLARAYRAKGDSTNAQVELQSCTQMVPLDGERSSAFLLYRALAKALLGNFSGAKDDCSEAMHADASEHSGALYIDRLYLACVEALEAQSEPGDSEARSNSVSAAVDQLKSTSTRHVEPVGYLRQFDDLKIVETLSENLEFANLFHVPQLQRASR
jgi:Flp pilus assembly protein TadD